MISPIELRAICKEYADKMVDALATVNANGYSQYGEYEIDKKLWEYFYNSFKERFYRHSSK